MKTETVIMGVLFILTASCTSKISEDKQSMELADYILQDTLMDKVETMSVDMIKNGFNAGDGYNEVWIRDYNTFIELAMEVMPDSLVRENLLTFFRFQGSSGDIVDGFTDIHTADSSTIGYAYRYSKTEPRYAAHKNTVETDQESSLIQAIWKYVSKSGNWDFLQQKVDGSTVEHRMEQALKYLINERYDEKYGLLWGATTSDWGDVQPEHSWGVNIDENSHLCIDIYDNASFIIAIQNFMDLTIDDSKKKYWGSICDQIKKNVRKYLWDEKQLKFIPHIYLADSPFPSDFDENKIFYHGGTAVAIEAGLLSDDEIVVSNQTMLDNVKKSGAPSIGLTIYPPYPKGFFLNDGMDPYKYQNGGDWTWFGGRMIKQLIRHGFVQEAYDEIKPMLERVVKNNGFYEWYEIDGIPSGSGMFRGEAGVLYSAIKEFRSWANNIKKADR